MREPHPPTHETAGHQKVMAAIAAAMASEEQAAAAKAIQQRQRQQATPATASHAIPPTRTPVVPAPQSVADPLAARCVPAQPGALPPAASVDPANPFAAALVPAQPGALPPAASVDPADPFAAALVPTQPGTLPPTGPVDPANPFAIAPVQSPERQISSSEGIDSMPARTPTVPAQRSRNRSLALSLSLASMLIIGVGAGFIWFRANNDDTTVESTAPPVPISPAAPSSPGSGQPDTNGGDALSIPVKTNPGH